MDERRRHERFGGVFPAEVRDRVNGRVIGLVSDISSGGMMVRTETPLDAGRSLDVTVEMPARAPETDAVAVDVRVRWCESDLEPGVHVAGLAFTGQTPPTDPRVQGLIRVLKSVS